MNPNDIKSYWLRAYDEEPGIYSLDIDTSFCTITYNRVKIDFIGNGNISFPARIEVLDENNNTINVFSITAKAKGAIPESSN